MFREAIRRNNSYDAHMCICVWQCVCSPKLHRGPENQTRCIMITLNWLTGSQITSCVCFEKINQSMMLPCSEPKRQTRQSFAIKNGRHALTNQNSWEIKKKNSQCHLVLKVNLSRGKNSLSHFPKKSNKVHLQHTSNWANWYHID